MKHAIFSALLFLFSAFFCDYAKGQSFQLIVTETPPYSGSWQPVERYLVYGSGGVAKRLSDIPKNMTYDPSSVAFRTPFELFVANRAAHTGKGSVSVFIMSSDASGFVKGPTITGNGLSDPHQIGFDPVSGELFATNWKSGLMSRFRFDKHGKPIANGTIKMPDSKEQLGVVVRKSDRQLFVSNYTFIRRFKRNSNGTYTYIGKFYPPNNRGIHFMEFLRGELYICALYKNQVHRYTFDKNGYPKLKESISSPSAVSVAFSLDGKEMFVASHFKGGVRRYTYHSTRDTWVYKSEIKTPRLGGVAVVPVDGSSSFTLYGKGCPGSNKSSPTISAIGSALAGNTMTVRVHLGLPNGGGVILLGTAAANFPLPGSCSLLVGGVMFPIATILDAGGDNWTPLAIPTGIPAGSLYFQFFGLDSAAPNGLFSTTNGLKVFAR